MDSEMKVLIERLQEFHRIYDVIRLVDPLNKKVILMDKNGLQENEFKCFDFWGNNKTCNNCVSMRSYNENQSFVKIEKSNDGLYMVISVPMEYEKKKLVLELIKNVTNSMFISDDSLNKHVEIYEFVNNLNDLALKDSLTEVYNRRAIDERLPIEILKAMSEHKPLSIILTDIDFFKAVNDNYGHIAGDYVLKTFSKKIKDCLKEKDWIARYGGEEFIICLIDTPNNIAIEFAEDIRKQVESMDVLHDSKNIKITASFGVSTIKEDTISYEELIKKADKNLYEAKRSGRNKVIY